MTRLLPFLIIALLACMPSAFAQTPASMALGQAQGAEAAPQLPKDYRPGDVDSLVAPLPDDQVRRLLISELWRQATTREIYGATAGFTLDEIDESLDVLTAQFRVGLRQIVQGFRDLPSDWPLAVEILTDTRSEGHLFIMVLQILVAVGLAYGVQFGYRRLTRDVRERIIAADNRTIAETGGRILLKTGIG